MVGGIEGETPDLSESSKKSERYFMFKGRINFKGRDEPLAGPFYVLVLAAGLLWINHFLKSYYLVLRSEGKKEARQSLSRCWDDSAGNLWSWPISVPFFLSVGPFASLRIRSLPSNTWCSAPPNPQQGFLVHGEFVARKGAINPRTQGSSVSGPPAPCFRPWGNVGKLFLFLSEETVPFGASPQPCEVGHCPFYFGHHTGI